MASKGGSMTNELITDCTRESCNLKMLSYHFHLHILRCLCAYRPTIIRAQKFIQKEGQAHSSTPHPSFLHHLILHLSGKFNQLLPDLWRQSTPISVSPPIESQEWICTQLDRNHNLHSLPMRSRRPIKRFHPISPPASASVP